MAAAVLRFMRHLHADIPWKMGQSGKCCIITMTKWCWELMGHLHHHPTRGTFVTESLVKKVLKHLSLSSSIMHNIASQAKHYETWHRRVSHDSSPHVSLDTTSLMVPTRVIYANVFFFDKQISSSRNEKSSNGDLIPFFFVSFLDMYSWMRDGIL